MFRYVADESLWPIAAFDSPGPRPSSEIDQESFYTELERVLRRGERFAALHDLRRTQPDAGRRKRFSEWVNSHTDDLAHTVVAYAIIIDSAVQKHILTAVLWSTKAPCPMKVFTQRSEAEEWLRSELRKVAAIRYPSPA